MSSWWLINLLFGLTVLPYPSSRQKPSRLSLSTTSSLSLAYPWRSDQGTNFEGNLFRAFCEKFQISKTRTTPYYLSSNGQVERYNRTLLPMIRSYIEGNQRYWDRDLSLLVISLHATINRQTGFTPNRLMLWREVFQPVDLLLGTPKLNTESHTPAEWAQSLKNRLSSCHQLVRERLKSKQERQKRDYDPKKLREFAYHPGDLVWKLHQTCRKGSSFKLESPHKGPFLVVKSRPPLYIIEGQKSRDVIHHDKLTPCHATEMPLWIRRKRHALLSESCDPPSNTPTDPSTSLRQENPGPSSKEVPPSPDIESESPSSEFQVVSLSDGLGANSVETNQSEDPCDISKEISLSESQGDSPCGACPEMVGAGSDSIACDGPCQTWFHLKCTDLSHEDFLRYCH